MPGTDEVEPTTTRAQPEAALATLFAEHYSALVGLGVVLTGDRPLAEDIAQEAFARLWKNWDNVRDHAAAPSYLRTTAVNLGRSALRRRRLAARDRSSSIPENHTDSTDRIEILRALRSVPYRQRVCIALRYYEGLSTDEIAETLGISVGTVKSQTHKAMKRLRSILGGEQ